jgi:hypothetical protein
MMKKIKTLMPLDIWIIKNVFAKKGKVDTDVLNKTFKKICDGKVKLDLAHKDAWRGVPARIGTPTFILVHPGNHCRYASGIFRELNPMSRTTDFYWDLYPDGTLHRRRATEYGDEYEAAVLKHEREEREKGEAERRSQLNPTPTPSSSARMNFLNDLLRQDSATPW